MSSSDKITILLADDHAILSEGTASVLKEYEAFVLLGNATDGEQALSMVIEHEPDVLVSDITMPGKSVFNIVEAIEEQQAQDASADLFDA